MLYTPISHEHSLTFIALALIAIVGYLNLRIKKEVLSSIDEITLITLY